MNFWRRLFANAVDAAHHSQHGLESSGDGRVSSVSEDNIGRREFSERLMAGLGLAALAPHGALAAVTQPPSVVLFLSDDLGYGDLACYGNPINRTPNLDALARAGCRFTDAHAASSVCSPARAALFTGRHPYRLGLYYLVELDAHLRREEISVASLLKARGYDTCFVGKWHVSRLGEKNMGQPSPSDFGFDHWFATEHNAFEGPHNPRDFIRNGTRVGEVQGWYCDVIVAEALDWLRRRKDQTRPYFIYVCSHEPHTPVSPPDRYADMYPSSVLDRQQAKIQYGDVPRPEQDLSENRKYYHGTVTQLDDAVGRLLKGVKAAEPANEPLVLFTSDNGPEYPVNVLESQGQWQDTLRDRSFGTPGPLRGMKRFTYEGGHRVPLIVRWPGHVRRGRVCDDLVNGTDILPTLCELSGASVPTDRIIDGVSIAPMFEGRPVTRPIPACWTSPVGYPFIPNLAMREGSYVITAWFPPKPKEQFWIDYIKTSRPERYELYDLHTDIGQREDLAKREPQRLARMADTLGTLWAGIQAEAPTWKEWNRR
jgi:arylsulfatase A